MSRQTFGAFLLTLCFLSRAIYAAELEVGTLYIKNNAKATSDIWVDDVYQGYVPAGKTAYLLKEGFVTSNSGKGRENTKESHGGWASRNVVTVKFRFRNEGDEQAVSSSITVVGNDERTASMWIGSKAPGEPISSLDKERATQIFKGAAKPFEGDLAEDRAAVINPALLGSWLKEDDELGDWMRVLPNGQVVDVRESGDEKNEPYVSERVGFATVKSEVLTVAYFDDDSKVRNLEQRASS